ncbi:MAG: phosphohistidine phosphatase SixA [Verrucomicrobiota bacterium]|jgi:phosphohistidine phosphatase
MNLFFLRHGKAFPRGPKWRPDSKRPLTREGEEKMKEAARGMAALEVSFDLILASPYARALRTAEIVAEVYGAKKLFETSRLVPEARPQDIIDEINGNFAAFDQIVLVGHEPFLSGLISTLLSGGGAVSIDLKKGALCKLSIEKLVFGKCARLDWLLTASQLARAGKSGGD